MPVDITIPSPGESVTEVTLGQWHKRSGEWVEKDEPLVEIESDKVTLEVPAPASGLLQVSADSGAEKNVGDRIGSIDPSAKKPSGDGQAAKASSEQKQAKGEARAKAPAPDHPARSAAANEAATAEAAARDKAPAKPGGLQPPRSAEPEAAAASSASERATSMARKLAAEKGVSLAGVQGTGPAGRIRKSDVLAASTKPAATDAKDSGGGPIAPRSSAPSIVATSEGPHRGAHREKMTKIRRRIAERLVAAQHSAAMLTTFNEADMGEIIRLRSQHKEDFEKRYGVGLGFMSFFVKACVSALQAFPRVNSYIASAGGGAGGGAGDEIEYHDYCDVSIAVGTDKGLVVPIIRNAELLSFAEIEETIKDLATRGRDGKLSPEEMTGGTFTITNGGIYGSLNSTPILNPPQSGILGMHAIKKRAVEYPVGDGQIALRPMMYIALSYDHRIVDGSEAVSFLVHVKNAVENPERMLLGL